MRRHHAALLALLGAAACRSQAPALLGAGDPRSGLPPSLADFVNREFDSLHRTPAVKVVRWSASLDGGLRRETIQAMRFAADPKVIGVVGHSGSRESLLAANVYNADQLPQIVPTGTSRKLRAAGPWTFRLVPNDSVEGEFLADVAIDSLHAKSVSIFYVGDEYGVGLRDGVASAMRRRGLDPREQVRFSDQGCLQERNARLHRETALASLLRHRPDVVVLAVRSNVAGCLMTTIAEALPEAQFLSGDGVTLHSPEIRSLPPELRARLGTVTFWDPTRGDSSGSNFIARAHAYLGREPDAGDALNYDAYQLLAAAVREAGPSRNAVRQWLESLGRTRDPWQGVTGAIRFDVERRSLLRLSRPAVVSTR